ncbi:MAG TPA: type II toxin-antitoxin system death-on-curing family toxin [Candidatus Nanopelagicales bacterium]
MIAFLSLDDLLAAAEAAVGRTPEVRDYGLLESALARPKATVFGADAYPGIHDKAAALLHSLVRNHALVDGNKRLGWVAVRLFYVLNGLDLRADHDDAFAFVMGVAAGEITEIAAMSLWLEARAGVTS